MFANTCSGVFFQIPAKSKIMTSLFFLIVSLVEVLNDLSTLVISVLL